MIPTFNYILFYFSALFTINSSIISKQTAVFIDLENKICEIEYTDLRVPSGDIENVKEELNDIENSMELTDRYSGLVLKSKKIYKKGKKLNAKLIFTYTNQEQLFQHLYFSSKDGDIYYLILKIEKVSASNGEKVKEDKFNLIKWDKGQKQIKLTLKRGKFGEKELDDNVSLLNYWKK